MQKTSGLQGFGVQMFGLPPAPARCQISRLQGKQIVTARASSRFLRLMDKILHDPKDPKLWELRYIPYKRTLNYGNYGIFLRILSSSRIFASARARHPKDSPATPCSDEELSSRAPAAPASSVCPGVKRGGRNLRPW